MEALNEGTYGTSNLMALSSFKKKLKEPGFRSELLGLPRPGDPELWRKDGHWIQMVRTLAQNGESPPL
jgi:hypothetical protein